MSYIKAEEILPKELIEVIQQYVCGKSIYIPCTEKQTWGSYTHSRQYYRKRNHDICNAHKAGIPVTELSKRYSLSEKTIYRVLRDQKGTR